jgi:geranylgeranyl diphosphate synthase, type II
MSELEAALQERRLEVERALNVSLPADTAWPPRLHEAMRYSLFAGGKRIRPLLVLGACDAVGGSHEEALPFACAVEMVHTFSLIHDDLPAMDDDDLRRGKPTSHKVYGEALAILAGDALLARAFHLLSGVPADLRRLLRRAQAMTLLGEAVGANGLIGGQVEDMAAQGQAVSGDTLERIHRCKTGALLSASVRGGALLGGADAEQLDQLRGFGSAIGLAFQVVDDILDATEGAEQLGKTAGKDKAAQKATYVRVHGLPAAREKAQALLKEALAALEPFGPRAELLRHLGRRIVDRHA